MLRLIDMDVQPSQLQHKGRSNNVSDANGLICYWGTHVLGISRQKLPVSLKSANLPYQNRLNVVQIIVCATGLDLYIY